MFLRRVLLRLNPLWQNGEVAQCYRPVHWLRTQSGPDQCEHHSILYVYVQDIKYRINEQAISIVQTVGHADLFTDTAGDWWAVALATRNATVN